MGMISESLPGLRLLREYRPDWLRGDVVAGVVLAAYLLPASLGDASLAGLPAQAGLYSCLFAGLVFWLFCSSRHTAVTVTSAISLLIGISLGELAGGDPARYAALAAATALLVAALASVAWLARAGSLVSFISETVHDRLQDRRGAAPRQHPAAEAASAFKGRAATSGSGCGTSSRSCARRTPLRWRWAPRRWPALDARAALLPNRPVSPAGRGRRHPRRPRCSASRAQGVAAARRGAAGPARAGPAGRAPFRT